MRGGTPKVALVGTGYVGGAYAFDLMLSGLATEIVLIDADEDKARSQALDLSHGLSFARPCEIRAGGYEDCAGSDLVAITAGASTKPGQTRLDLVETNAKIFEEIVPQVARHAPDCVMMIVTNPVDVMTWVALRLSEFPPGRVFGSGTVLDTARLRYLISSHCGVDIRNVHANIIGEHGDSELPVWSLVNIGGMAMEEYCALCGKGCDHRERLRGMFEEVKNAAYKIVAAKGGTAYGIAQAMVKITESVLRDESSVLPVSSLVPGYYGVEDVCLGMPSVVAAGGVERMLELPLSGEEEALFVRSAETIRSAIEGLGIGV